jgi:hypothetical protein
MRSFRILMAVVLLAAASAALAGETGSISGKVTDASGGPVPGVIVKVSGAQLPAGRTSVTSANGAYNFQRLIPGKYTVAAELTGLGKANRAATVLVDNDSQVDLVLRGGTEAMVEVTAAAVDQKSTEVAVNYVAEEIKNLPLSRSYNGLLELIPGAAVGSSGAAAVAGGSRQDNKYMVDGVNITNPGYGTLIVQTNEIDIVDFSAKTAGISAEFGRTSGAMVNAVTRSGTNDFKGGLRFEAQPDSFISDPKSGAAESKVDRYTGAGYLGFPIVKDTLFGYVSARYFSSTSSGRQATVGGVTTTQPDTKSNSQDYFGKLTGNIGQSLLLNAGFRALPNETTNGFDSLYDLPSAAYDADTTNYVTNVSASWFVSNNSFVEAKYVHLTEDDTVGAQTVLTGQPSTIDPKNLGKFGAYYDTARNGGNVGVYEFASLGDTYKRDEIKLTASQFLDWGETQHQIKLGGGYENDTYELVRQTNGWGLMTFPSTCPSAVCGTSRSGQVRARYYTLQPQQTGKARTYSVFLQDTITWNRFSATLGVLVNKDDFAQIALDGTRYNFMTFDWKDEIQPRIGVIYNTELLKGDKVYANYGRYYGLDQKSTSRSFAPFRIRQDQAWFDVNTGAYLGQQIRGSSTGKVIPQDLKAPYQDELVLGYAAPVGKYLSFEVYYQYRTTDDFFEDVPIDPNNYFGSFKAANLPWASRSYRGYTLNVNKRLSDNWTASMNYTYSQLRGNFDIDYSFGIFNTSSLLEDGPGLNTFEPNRYGTLQQDRPHILKLFGSYDFPFGLTAGGYFRYQSGTAWEARGMDSNGSFGRYLEPAGTRRLPAQTNFDLLLAYNFRFGDSMTLRIEGRAVNLFNSQEITSVDRVQYLDGYKDGTPASTMGPQGTTQPNANFGLATAYATSRRYVLSANFDF